MVIHSSVKLEKHTKKKMGFVQILLNLAIWVDIVRQFVVYNTKKYQVLSFHCHCQKYIVHRRHWISWHLQIIVTCHLSHGTYHLSHVTYQISPTPSAKAKHSHPANSPTMLRKLFHQDRTAKPPNPKTPNPKTFQKIKNSWNLPKRDFSFAILAIRSSTRSI